MRSAWSVVEEMERALELGYDRISFADDVFTLDAARVARHLRARSSAAASGAAGSAWARVDGFDLGKSWPRR